METKKYDIIIVGESHHYPVPENGIGNVPIGPPGSDFNRNPGKYPSILKPDDLPNGYGRFGTAMGVAGGLIEIYKNLNLLYREINNYERNEFYFSVLRNTSNALRNLKNAEGINYFEYSIKFDDKGYAHYDLNEGGSISDPNGPKPIKVDLGSKSISPADLAKIKEAGQQAVRDFNTRKMIKDFSDRAEKWGGDNPPIYDYKDVPATNGGWPSGNGGGSFPKNNKPKHIV